MKINFILEKQLDEEIRRIKNPKKIRNLTSLQHKIDRLHKQILNDANKVDDRLKWIFFPNNLDLNQIKDMKRIVKKLLAKKITTLVVIASPKIYLGIKAAVDFINTNELTSNKKFMEVIFIENSLSSVELTQKLNYVRSKNFAINIISTSDVDFEAQLVFRFFKDLLYRQFGDDISERVFITAPITQQGIWTQIANFNNFKIFVAPANVGEKFAIFSLLSFFPMLCAGIDLKKLIYGATQANRTFSQPDVRINQAYQYAAARYVLFKKRNIPMEFLISFDHSFASFNSWWKFLFSTSELVLENLDDTNQNYIEVIDEVEEIQKLEEPPQDDDQETEDNEEENNIDFDEMNFERKELKTTGIFPNSAVFSTDIHTLGQFIQSGSKIFFETLVFVKEPAYDILIAEENKSLFRKDLLDKYAQKTVHEINKASFFATIDSHSISGNIAQLVMKLEDHSAETFGWLAMFFQRAYIMYAYLLGVDVFDETGIEIINSNFWNILNKKLSNDSTAKN